MKLSLSNLYIEFFKSKPIVTFLSFIFTFFYVAITIFFPKYLGLFISRIQSLDRKSFYSQLLKLLIIYLVFWIGIIIHFYIVHTKLLYNNRSFFMNKINEFIWEQIKNSRNKSDLNSIIIKNLNTLNVTSSQLIQGLIFIIIPISFSGIAFILSLPNFIYIKIIYIITFIIISLLMRKFSGKIQDIQGRKSIETIKSLAIIEDNLCNELNILNYNTINKELNNLNKNYDLVNLNGYKSGLNQWFLKGSVITILISSLLLSIYIYTKNNSLSKNKKFLAVLLPMMTSIVLVVLTNLNKIITVLQNLGEQKENINQINKFINLKKYSINQLNKSEKKSYNSDNKLVLENVFFEYDSGKTIFNNLCFEFYTGLNLIVGPSGCGKTTLLQLIYGSLILNKGRIYFNNEEFSPKKIEVWRNIFFYQEQFPCFFSKKDYIENLNYGLTQPEIIKLNNLIEELNVKNYFNDLKKNNQIKFLSGGEKQLLYIIRGFCLSSKKIFLIDEPTASLDMFKKEIICQLIKKYKDEKIIIVNSHDPIFYKYKPLLFDFEKIVSKKK